MPQYDYSTTPVAPAQAVLQSLQMAGAFQGMRQQQQAEQRRQQMQQTLAKVQAAPTPEGFANLYLQFPELKDQLDSYRKTIGEGDKNTLLSASREALTLRRAGRPAEVVNLFGRYADAARNSNRPDLAKQFDDAKRVYEIDPEGSGDFALRMLYQSLDNEGYKSFFGETPAIQNWQFFRKELGDEEAKRIIGADDDIVTTLPNQGFYAGPRSGLAEALRGGRTADSPRVGNVEEYNRIAPGSVYTDPSGVTRVKPGGGGSNAAGGFRE